MHLPALVGFRKFSILCTTALLSLGLGKVGMAQVVIAPAPTVGSSNPVSAEPLIPRPATTPCKVALFQNLAFNDFNERTFSYTPPADCPGPWAKVVFSADLTVTAGVQYDRSAQVYLGQVTLFRGTTAEPGSSFSPSWHVENDVTDLSAALTSAQSGVANIQNLVDSTYTGVIYANAELDFYPTSSTVPAATVPDQVVPVYNNGDAFHYYDETSPLAESITLPTNVVRLYLDVYTQGGSTDEFWYFCTPDATSGAYIYAGECNATAFREAEVSIDGAPAGIAPWHPYIFTGGMDPNLWIPIPGAQTLNLKPYRVDLTPFAAIFDDGNPHTIQIDNVHIQNSTLVNANLLVYLDPGSKTVTGAVTSNSLTANPSTNVTVNDNLDSNGNGTANITESLNRNFTISGYVNTSQGKVTTTIDETVNFVNNQQLTNFASPVVNVVDEDLTSTVDATVTTAAVAGTSVVQKHTSNPLHLLVNESQNGDGTYEVTTTAGTREDYTTQGPGDAYTNSSEDVQSTDAIQYDSSFNYLGDNGQGSTGSYTSSDSLGNTYSETLTAANFVLTGVTTTSSSAATSVLLTSSAANVTQGSGVTLTTTVKAVNNSNTPTGYVTFYFNGTALETVSLQSGVAMLTLSTLPVGADVITASYGGDSNFQTASTVNSVTVTVTALTASFTMTSPSPTTLSVLPGGSGVATLSVTANAAFNGTVTFSCSGAPASSRCTVSPGSVVLAAGQSATASVVLTTTDPNNTQQSRNQLPGFARAMGGTSLAGIFLLCWPGKRKALRRYLSLVLLAVGALGAASILTGCGTSYMFGGTPAGSYTLTVTAQSGSVAQTANLAVTVQ
jgi:hypothetical protein